MQWYGFGTTASALTVAAMLLSACSNMPSSRKHHIAADDEHFVLVGHPDFDWSLSGDRRVAPLQVFSDQSRVWLQWHEGQPIPSVMVAESGQWLVADLKQHGKFSVIEGRWRELRFQGGRLRANAHYGSAVRRRERTTETGLVPKVAAAVVPVAASSPSPTATQKTYEVTLADQTVRQTLLRWAHQSQWHFSNSHWSVPVDIPVTAQAVFDGEFIESVRSLLAAADIAGRPLQPCFYSNRVLRVISANESCDPTVQLPGAT